MISSYHMHVLKCHPALQTEILNHCTVILGAKSRVNSQFLTNTRHERQQAIGEAVGFHPHGWCGLSFGVPTLTCSNPECCEFLGNKQANRRSLSVSIISAFQTNHENDFKILMKYKVKIEGNVSRL